MAYDDWQAWSNGKSTRGISLVNGKVPRGPIMGCHVAPLYWLLVLCKIIGVRGVRPPDLPTAYSFHKLRPTNGSHIVPCNIYEFNCISIRVCDRWQGVGPGLSPGPRSFDCIYDHTIYGIARQLVGAGFIIHSPWFYVICHMPTTGARGVSMVGTVVTVWPFCQCARSYGPLCAQVLGG
jgi:hypothetical protein